MKLEEMQGTVKKLFQRYGEEKRSRTTVLCVKRVSNFTAFVFKRLSDNFLEKIGFKFLGKKYLMWKRVLETSSILNCT